MEKNLYIDAAHPEETRVVLKSKYYIEEYESENKNNLNLKNNIYLGIVSRVEPSLQAAFINYGRERHGFLAFNDIQSDYYQIPTGDKDELKKHTLIASCANEASFSSINSCQWNEAALSYIKNIRERAGSCLDIH